MVVVLKIGIPSECQVRGKGGLITKRSFKFKGPQLLALECAIRPKRTCPDADNPRAMQIYFQTEAEQVIRERVDGLISLSNPHLARFLTIWLDASRKKPESILPLLDRDVPIGVVASEFRVFASKLCDFERIYWLRDLPYGFHSPQWHYPRYVQRSHPVEGYRDSANLPV